MQTENLKENSVIVQTIFRYVCGSQIKRLKRACLGLDLSNACEPGHSCVWSATPRFLEESDSGVCKVLFAFICQLYIEIWP